MILKLAVVALLGFVTFKLFKNKPPEVKGKDENSAVELEQDPIDGVYVDKDTEFKVKYHDKVYYFSTKENMDKFIEEKRGNS
ncbi:YHS domain-containing protein [Limisalsivibrio acetivorans]|uniref:YHS domain-containing protein n=1 Tax=Limisalsivibrio acetivorans TaxID=1304888 RepID=UPI0003B6D6C5|nr:YHS domain-containing protein [Limisalsivibrio acetivorans]